MRSAHPTSHATQHPRPTTSPSNPSSSISQFPVPSLTLLTSNVTAPHSPSSSTRSLSRTWIRSNKLFLQFAHQIESWKTIPRSRRVGQTEFEDEPNFEAEHIRDLVLKTPLLVRGFLGVCGFRTSEGVAPLCTRFYKAYSSFADTLLRLILEVPQRSVKQIGKILNVHQVQVSRMSTLIRDFSWCCYH